MHCNCERNEQHSEGYKTAMTMVIRLMWSEEIYYNPNERQKMLNDLESMLFGKGKHVAQYSSSFEILKIMKSTFFVYLS